MSQNVTDSQRQAVSLILAGKTDGEVAQAVGVARETVNRWRNGDDLFMITLNAERHRLWDAHRERLTSLVGKAITAVEKGLELDPEAGWKVGLQVLKVVGLEAARPGKPETLEALERERRHSELLQSLGMFA